MITLKGKVFNSMERTTSGGYQPMPSVQVFISDEDGVITPKKIGTITDKNGNFTLSLPTVMISNVPFPNVDGKYITARYGTDSTKKELTGTNTYNFDFATKSGVQNVQEVFASASKNPKSTTDDKKFEAWKVFLAIGLATTIIGVGIFAYQKFKK